MVNDWLCFCHVNVYVSLGSYVLLSYTSYHVTYSSMNYFVCAYILISDTTVDCRQLQWMKYNLPFDVFVLHYVVFFVFQVLKRKPLNVMTLLLKKVLYFPTIYLYKGSRIICWIVQNHFVYVAIMRTHI